MSTENGHRTPGPAAVARVWPAVTLRGDQVWLNLEPDTVALTIPVSLAVQATKILHRWRCHSLALIHPDAPEHRVVLAGQRHSVAPPYSRSVHRTTGTLPPTVTPCGPLTWVRPPRANTLSLCGEFEVFAALRTALRDPPAYLSAACGPSGCRCGPVRES